MTEVKLIAMDLDGTLFNKEGQITPKTKEELNKLNIKNYKITSASDLLQKT